MKLRNGFVSNSSSTSFCIGRSTEINVKEFMSRCSPLVNPIYIEFVEVFFKNFIFQHVDRVSNVNDKKNTYYMEEFDKFKNWYNKHKFVYYVDVGNGCDGENHREIANIFYEVGEEKMIQLFEDLGFSVFEKAVRNEK